MDKDFILKDDIVGKNMRLNIINIGSGKLNFEDAIA